MLVLTRKPGESIRIGEDISIRVIGVQRRQVRFAIDAPREIPVHREEVYELIQKENHQDLLAKLKGWEEILVKYK